MFSGEAHFCFSSDSRQIWVWSQLRDRFNPAATMKFPPTQEHRIMVWGVIAYDSRSPLIHIQDTMAAQQYADDVLQPVASPTFRGCPKPDCILLASANLCCKMYRCFSGQYTQWISHQSNTFWMPFADPATTTFRNRSEANS